MNAYSPPISSRPPARRLIVADPTKMSYFAEANAARMSVHHTAGAFSGLSGGEPGPQNNTAMDIAGAAGSFFRNLIGNPGLPPPTVAPPAQGYAPDNTILGLPPALAIGIGLAIVGGGGYMLLRKKR